MKPYIPITLLCISSFTLHAQQSAVIGSGNLHKESSRPEASQPGLRAISKIMYEGGNIDFLLVEALADSLIQEATPFDLACRASHVTFNDKELPDALQKKYDQLAHSFYAKYDPDMVYGKSTAHFDGLMLKDVLDSNSEFRAGQTSKSNYRDIIIAEMAADKLVDSAKKGTITYTIDGIAINGRLLPPKFQNKYKKRFAELEKNIPKHAGDTISIQTGPKGSCTAPKG